MRVADTLLDLEEEAVPASRTVLGLLPTHPPNEFPSAEQHLKNRKDDRDQLTQDVNETEEEFQNRLERWRTWPRRAAMKQEQWLRCATITNWVLNYVIQHDNPKGHFRSEDDYIRAFSPRQMYKYL